MQAYKPRGMGWFRGGVGGLGWWFDLGIECVKFPGFCKGVRKNVFYSIHHNHKLEMLKVAI